MTDSGAQGPAAGAEPLRVEDPDPADVDLVPVLWGRMFRSVPFALGVACWVVALASRVADRIVGLRIGTGPLLIVMAAPVLWAIDAGRRDVLFSGLPRAWDDPPDPVRVDWWRPRASVFGRRGFVHAGDDRVRVVWGTVHGWDLLVVVGAVSAMGLTAPLLALHSAAYVVGCAIILGLPRRRRVEVDYELREILDVEVAGNVFTIRTSREGRDGAMTFQTWKSHRDAMVAHLAAAFPDRMSIRPAR